ncbi:MAG: hypothetical protein QXU82_02420 [Candidatus Aenigmatarchaeota archaeon]
MDTLCEGKVLNVKEGNAIVDISGVKKPIPVRGDIKLRKGDKVLIAFGYVVDKLK